MLNNVETFANVPNIILKGADRFRSNGTETFLIVLNPTSERKTLVLDGEIDPYLSALKSVKGLVSPLLTTGKATCKRTAKGTTLKLDATSGMIIKL